MFSHLISGHETNKGHEASGLSALPPHLACLALVPCLLHKSLKKTCPFLQNCEHALILENFGSALSKTYFLACDLAFSSTERKKHEFLKLFFTLDGI
jgi:hypothetical protein